MINYTTLKFNIKTTVADIENIFHDKILAETIKRLRIPFI